MQTVTKRLMISCFAFLAPQMVMADTLKDIYETALQNDPVLSAARASFNANSEAKNIGRAALLPQLAASGEYRESETNDVGLGTIDSDTTSYNVSLSQAIFDMPAWYQFQGSKALSESARAQFSADQQSLIIRVSDAYFNVLRAYDNMETRKAE